MKAEPKRRRDWIVPGIVGTLSFLVAGAVFVVVGLRGGEVPLVVPDPGAGAAGNLQLGTSETLGRRRGTVRLRELYPGRGSTINRMTVISAEVEYSIDDFDPQADPFYIGIQFRSTGAGTLITFVDLFAWAELTEPTGTVSLTYPVETVWSKNQLAKPVTVYFLLHQAMGGGGSGTRAGRSMVIARTEPVIYQVP